MNRILQLHHGITRFDTHINAWAGSLLSLAIRLFIGWQFFKAGMLKVDDWGATLALFQHEYDVPLLPPSLAAILGTAGELVFPILLAAGLFTRPAALGLFAVNAMVLLSYPALWEFECPAAVRDHLYWGALLLVPLAFGPGRIAIDDWLAKPR
ncbi:MAG TPA: DoxX family protein [Noviherbaspirillum sp.]